MPDTPRAAGPEKPILFSGPMVRAILKGRKSQTRRVIKEHLLISDPDKWEFRDRGQWAQFVTVEKYQRSGEPVDGFDLDWPYSVGDHLWVRETWQTIRNLTVDEQLQQKHTLNQFMKGEIPTDQIAEAAMSLPVGSGTEKALYAADFGAWAYDVDSDLKPWKPSIFMPRWASRITLEVTDVRVERVQEISKADALAEGISVLPLQDVDDPSAWYQSAPGVHQERSAQQSYAAMWQSINGKKYLWSSNPWVWVYSFRVVKPEQVQK